MEGSFPALKSCTQPDKDGHPLNLLCTGISTLFVLSDHPPFSGVCTAAFKKTIGLFFLLVKPHRTSTIFALFPPVHASSYFLIVYKSAHRGNYFNIQHEACLRKSISVILLSLVNQVIYREQCSLLVKNGKTTKYCKVIRLQLK